MQILERKHPTQLRSAPESRKNARPSISDTVPVHLSLPSWFPPVKLCADLSTTRTSVDFANHLRRVTEHFPDVQGFE